MGRPVVDLLDPDFYVGDPYPAYRWMRDNEPVYRDEKNGLWAITRMEDVRTVERRADVFVSSRGYRSVHTPPEASMISKDDPAHAEQRRLISEQFTPRAVQTRENEIRALVVSCIERVRPHGVAEVVHALAARIPATLTCRLIGFPDAYWTLLDDWSSKLMRIDVVYRQPPALNDSMLAMIDLGEAARALFEERRRAPQDDLMSIWARSSLGGRPLDFETVHWELGLVVPGGVDTTRTTIARSLILLAERPALLTQMAEDPGVIPSAVEELLRYLTPLNQMFRTVAVDAEVGGRAIPAGGRLCLVYPSANRDDAVFDRPDEIDFRRSPNPHVAFGLGTHFCLGANLARLTLRVFFEELAARIQRVEPIAAPVYEANVFIKGVRRFDVRLHGRGDA
jgi:cytochrome P450 family 142 subfamily A polypeptide 1